MKIISMCVQVELDQSCSVLLTLLNHSQQMGNGELEMNTKYEFSSINRLPQLIHDGLCFTTANSSSDPSLPDQA